MPYALGFMKNKQPAALKDRDRSKIED